MSNSENPIKIEMGDLDGEKESLANFLQKHLKLNPSLNREGLEINGTDVSAHDLLKMVNKFVNSKKLNSTHWVSMHAYVITINRFNHKKNEKKNKHPRTASTIKHGW